ncbi:MAG: BMC domain-containing protein [Ignavibacteriales bacterium]|nr:BMC domain-containing protein [Ignavibacteriales bacterium]
MLELALGLVETRGLVAAIEAADAMMKAADVQLVGKDRVDPGMITIKIVGEVAAVRSAVDAGSAAAARVGQLISSHIIPRPADEIEMLIYTATFPKKQGDDDSAFDFSRYPKLLSNTKEVFLEDLDEMNVHELRKYARTLSGLSLQGREISNAVREELETEILRIKFP